MCEKIKEVCEMKCVFKDEIVFKGEKDCKKCLNIKTN